mgnify:FL=1
MSGDEAPRQRERWLAMTGKGRRTPRAFVPCAPRQDTGPYKRKDSAPCGALSFYMRVLPLQVLFRLLAEHVGHIAAEDHVDLAAHGEVGGVAVGGDDDHHIMAVGGDMQMHRGAHQLTDIHGALDAVGAEHDVIGANAQRHVLFRYIFSAEPGLLILGQFHIDAVDSHGVFAVAVLHQLRVKEVHLGRADKAGHEQIGRVVKDLLGRADLLDEAIFHDDDAVAQGHGLGLVMGDVDKRGVDPLAQLDDLGAHLVAELGVQVGQGLVQQEDCRVTDLSLIHI